MIGSIVYKKILNQKIVIFSVFLIVQSLGWISHYLVVNALTWCWFPYLKLSLYRLILSIIHTQCLFYTTCSLHDVSEISGVDLFRSTQILRPTRVCGIDKTNQRCLLTCDIVFSVFYFSDIHHLNPIVGLPCINRNDKCFKERLWHNSSSGIQILTWIVGRHSRTVDSSISWLFPRTATSWICQADRYSGNELCTKSSS